MAEDIAEMRRTLTRLKETLAPLSTPRRRVTAEYPLSSSQLEMIDELQTPARPRRRRPLEVVHGIPPMERVVVDIPHSEMAGREVMIEMQGRRYVPEGELDLFLGPEAPPKNYPEAVFERYAQRNLPKAVFAGHRNRQPPLHGNQAEIRRMTAELQQAERRRLRPSSEEIIAQAQQELALEGRMAPARPRRRSKRGGGTIGQHYSAYGKHYGLTQEGVMTLLAAANRAPPRSRAAYFAKYPAPPHRRRLPPRDARGRFVRA